MADNIKIEYVKIEELKPNEYNPKKMNEKEAEELEKSIREFGIVDPIIANSAENRKGMIIGGHQRFNIYNKIGMKEVPVVWINIPDLNKERKLCLRLSKTTGSWDFDMLANFSEEELLGVGFAGEELDEIFGLERTDDFDVKKELEKVLKENQKRVKAGEIWKLGEHRLIIGNSTDKECWSRVLAGEKFDFLFTDPPYKIAYGKNRTRKVKTKEGYKIKGRRSYESVGSTDGQGKSIRDPKQGFGYKGDRGVEIAGGVPEYDEWLSIANEYQNPKGANVMIFEYWKNMVELWQSVEKYWKVRNMIIWHLPNRHQGFSARGQFFGKYDIAPLAGDGKINEDFEIEFDKYLQEKGQKLIDSYDILMFGARGDAEWSKKKGGKMWTMSDHVTYTASSEAESGQNVVFGVKPTAILIPYIKILSPRGGIVMEPFGGSGSTIIASEIMKRKCRAIELSETYAEVIINRFEKFTGIKAEKMV